MQTDHEAAQARREKHDELFARCRQCQRAAGRSGMHPDEKDFTPRQPTVLCYSTLAAGLAACCESGGLPR